MRLRKALAPLLIVPMLALTAASSPSARSIPIPDDFAPEGIAVGHDGKFYTGSLWDGDIYRGDLRSGQGEVIVDEDAGQAVGLKVDDRRRLLVVAKGLSGQGAFYNSRSGELVTTRQLTTPGESFVNDVIVTRDAAYFTNSFGPQIVRVPISKHGRIGQPQTITVTGPASAPAQFGLNGIEATSDGTLIVAHSGLAGVFTVDPSSGVSAPITLPSGPLPDSVDGLLLHGRTLWAVSNFANTVSEIRLAGDLSRGKVVGTITNDDVGGLFRVPTTVAADGSRLVLVNGRFDQGLPPPLGTPAPPGTDYDVVVVKP